MIPISSADTTKVRCTITYQNSLSFGIVSMFMNAFSRWIDEIARHPNTVVLGDFNIAPEDRDVHDPEAWRGEVLCSEPERVALQRITDLGLCDCYRQMEQPEQQFSWFDYRAASFRRNRGLRIDLILASAPLLQHCRNSSIDLEPRGWERPSDHAPVLAEFDLA